MTEVEIMRFPFNIRIRHKMPVQRGRGLVCSAESTLPDGKKAPVFTNMEGGDTAHVKLPRP